MIVRVYIDYNSDDKQAFYILAKRIIESSSIPVVINPLILKPEFVDLTYEKLPFIIPYLSNFKGVSIYISNRVVTGDDIAKLVMDNIEKFKIKCIGRKNSKNPRFKKTISIHSKLDVLKKIVMRNQILVFNNSSCKELTIEFIEKLTLPQLHDFQWCSKEKIRNINISFEFTLLKAGRPWFESMAKSHNSEIWFDQKISAFDIQDEIGQINCLAGKYYKILQKNNDSYLVAPKFNVPLRYNDHFNMHLRIYRSTENLKEILNYSHTLYRYFHLETLQEEIHYYKNRTIIISSTEARDLNHLSFYDFIEKKDKEKKAEALRVHLVDILLGQLEKNWIHRILLDGSIRIESTDFLVLSKQKFDAEFMKLFKYIPYEDYIESYNWFFDYLGPRQIYHFIRYLDDQAVGQVRTILRRNMEYYFNLEDQLSS